MKGRWVVDPQDLAKRGVALAAISEKCQSNSSHLIIWKKGKSRVCLDFVDLKALEITRVVTCIDASCGDVDLSALGWV